MPKLQVYRTSIGFHDAYVAAPSRAAALRAWGADTDLFAMGAAQLVTDAKLTADPLKEPGKIIKASRGSATQHLEALNTATSAAKANDAARTATARPARMKPRPSILKLEDAEAALEAADRAHHTGLAALDEEIDALRLKRESLERQHERDRARLAKRVQTARDSYDSALANWRNATG